MQPPLSGCDNVAYLCSPAYAIITYMAEMVDFGVGP
jgi:hypothetical protein